VLVNRAFREAVDEVCPTISDNDAMHEGEDVVAAWPDTGARIEPPILFAGRVLGTTARDYLPAGSTRPRCSLVFLRRQAVTTLARRQARVVHALAQ
jgi:hypothetical protein